MNTIKIETGKGLKGILIGILEPIKVNVSPSDSDYRSVFEFIGTIDNPIDAIKNYGKGVYESLNILSVDEHLNIEG